MKQKIETQHLDGVDFGLFSEDSDDFLTGEDEIEDFIEANDSKTVAKAICLSLRTFVFDFRNAIRKELIDCYENRDD